MTLLGGAGRFFGPFIGATIYLVLEDEVSHVTEYWPLVIGFIPVLCVLFMKEGVTGWLFRIARGRVGAKIPVAVVPEPTGPHAASLAVPRQEAGR